MLELNKIYNIDCYKELPKLKNNGIDILITDPPYGINIIKDNKLSSSIGGNNIGKANEYKPIVGDNIKIDMTELFRVSKNQIIFGGNYFNLPISKGWIVWDKKKKDDWWDNFSDGELIWTSYNMPLRIKRHLFMGCMQEGKREKRVHPTQKPLALMEWIIQHYTKENDLILDPFAGTGTTLVACKKTGRNFIGFELSKEYYDIACDRLLKEKDNLREWM